MIDFTTIRLSKLALHLVGNKSLEEGFKIGQQLFEPEEEELKDILVHYFLDSFKMEEFYSFDHEGDLSLNEIFRYCSNIFDNKDLLYENSIHILQHLYDQSQHPKIKSGEVYIALFEDCLIEDELVDAVGIFKSETKDTYLKLLSEDESYIIHHDKGISTKRLDKGALILNTYKNEGYRVLSVDVKSHDARYWRDDFLKVTQLQDNGFHTKNYLSMCKEFVQEVVAKEEDKKEQVVFLNKSIDYFKNHEEFDLEEFKEEVIVEDHKAQQFDNFKQSYQLQKGIAPEENFFISQPAVKKMGRSFKNLIKLDTQMEIRINTTEDQEYIEKGFDPIKNMHFYKLFFNKED